MGTGRSIDFGEDAQSFLRVRKASVSRQIERHQELGHLESSISSRGAPIEVHGGAQHAQQRESRCCHMPREKSRDINPPQKRKSSAYGASRWDTQVVPLCLCPRRRTPREDVRRGR